MQPARLIMYAASNGNGTGTMQPPPAESEKDSKDEEAPLPKQQNPKLHNILQHGPRITILDPVRACTAVPRSADTQSWTPAVRAPNRLGSHSQRSGPAGARSTDEGCRLWF